MSSFVLSWLRHGASQTRTLRRVWPGQGRPATAFLLQAEPSMGPDVDAKAQ
jgi:hypothetical protein